MLKELAKNKKQATAIAEAALRLSLCTDFWWQEGKIFSLFSAEAMFGKREVALSTTSVFSLEDLAEEVLQRIRLKAVADITIQFDCIDVCSDAQKCRTLRSFFSHCECVALF